MGPRCQQGRLTWCWSVCPSSGCRCHTHMKGEGRAFHRRHQGLQLHGGSQSLNRSTADRCSETQYGKSHSEQSALPIQLAKAEMVSQKSPRSDFCDLTECKSLHSFPLPSELLLPVGLLLSWRMTSRSHSSKRKSKEQAQLTPSRTRSFSLGEVTNTRGPVSMRKSFQLSQTPDNLPLIWSISSYPTPSQTPSFKILPTGIFALIFDTHLRSTGKSGFPDPVCHSCSPQSPPVTLPSANTMSGPEHDRSRATTPGLLWR